MRSHSHILTCNNEIPHFHMKQRPHEKRVEIFAKVALSVSVAGRLPVAGVSHSFTLPAQGFENGYSSHNNRRSILTE